MPFDTSVAYAILAFTCLALGCAAFTAEAVMIRRHGAHCGAYMNRGILTIWGVILLSAGLVCLVTAFEENHVAAAICTALGFGIATGFLRATRRRWQQWWHSIPVHQIKNTDAPHPT